MRLYGNCLHLPPKQVSQYGTSPFIITPVIKAHIDVAPTFATTVEPLAWAQNRSSPAPSAAFLAKDGVALEIVMVVLEGGEGVAPGRCAPSLQL